MSSSQSFRLSDGLLRMMRASQSISSPNSTLKSDTMYDGGDSNQEKYLLITSMDFSEDGNYLITTQNASTLHENENSFNQCLAIYSTESGKCTHEIPSLKYGCDSVRFTHTNHLVLFASNNDYDHTVRQLDIQHSRFTRYFKGHQHTVLQIAPNPKSNQFCTVSKDQTLRFWDVSDSACTGKIPNMKGYPSLAYDPKGYVLAVSGALNTVRLYDVRNYSAGPFNSFVVDTEPSNFVNTEFSPDGKYISVSTQSGKTVVIHAFKGNKIYEIDPASNINENSKSNIHPSSTSIIHSYTQDSQYILTGSKYDGHIHAYNIEYIEEGTVPEIIIEASKVNLSNAPVHSVLLCPQKVLMAGCAGDHLSFWLPDVDASPTDIK